MSVRWIFDTPKVVSMQGFTPKLSFGKIASPPPIQDRDLPKWVAPTQTDRFEYTGQNPDGKPLATQVSSLINGGQIFNQVTQVMSQAKSSVLLDLYNLQNPALYPEKASEADVPGMVQQTQIIQRLVELKEKGLKVKVILDNHWDRDLNEGSNQRTINFLRSKGIETLTYPDFAKISHVKLMIVDDKFAVIGGMNWGNHSPSNHDAAVFIEGEDVRNLYTQIFKTDWLTAGGAPESLPDIEPFKPEVDSESKIKVLTTNPKDSVDGGSRSIFNELMKQIGNAQESI
ncbi:MAG: phospholipase D family protein, partial [Cyanobacteria bacterium]|nr:phospholipase D family protein [Cyanobacteriota bacterium]